MLYEFRKYYLLILGFRLWTLLRHANVHGALSRRSFNQLSPDRCINAKAGPLHM